MFRSYELNKNHLLEKPKAWNTSLEHPDLWDFHTYPCHMNYDFFLSCNYFSIIVFLLSSSMLVSFLYLGEDVPRSIPHEWERVTPSSRLQSGREHRVRDRKWVLILGFNGELLVAPDVGYSDPSPNSISWKTLQFTHSLRWPTQGQGRTSNKVFLSCSSRFLKHINCNF